MLSLEICTSGPNGMGSLHNREHFLAPMFDMYRVSGKSLGLQSKNDRRGRLEAPTVEIKVSDLSFPASHRAHMAA